MANIQPGASNNVNKGDFSNKERVLKTHDFNTVPGWNRGGYNSGKWLPSNDVTVNANSRALNDSLFHHLVGPVFVSHVYIKVLRYPTMMLNYPQVMASFRSYLCNLVEAVDGFPEYTLQTSELQFGTAKDPIIVPTFGETSARNQLTFTTLESSDRALWKLIDWWQRGIVDPITGIYHGHGALDLGDLVRRDPRGYTCDLFVIVTNQHPSPDGVHQAGILVNAFPSTNVGNITSASVADPQANFEKPQVVMHGTYFQDNMTTLLGKYLMAASGAWINNEYNQPQSRQMYDLLQMKPEEVQQLMDMTHLNRAEDAFDSSIYNANDINAHKTLAGMKDGEQTSLPYPDNAKVNGKSLSGNLQGDTEGNTIPDVY